MKFSVICLTFKRIRLLNEAVYSVLQQTHTDYELLIINDNATQRLAFDHPKVKIFNLNTKFKTLGDKRNFGVKQATGDIILQLDDDDLLLPDYLQNYHTLIGEKADFVSVQRPIVYYNDPTKIVLSPYALTNTFLYRRKTVGENFHYASQNFDELTPFYVRVRDSHVFSRRMGLLKPEQCGYVYRQDADEYKKYSMGMFKTESLDEQERILSNVDDIKGDIVLEPKWEKDYVSIIKSHCKFLPLANKSPLDDFIKEQGKDWTSTKISWEKALKFAEAVNSRGILSTVADLLNINKTSGERVSDELLEQRKLSCFGDLSKGKDPCIYLRKVPNKGSFCSSCGCGAKDIAKLDGDGYTKLHYPYLECPLRKRGFSNADISEIDGKPPISIIIPVLNDNIELNLTIDSIYKTSPETVEIIVIDDASDIPVEVSDKRVKLVRFNERRGAGQARHFGATQATSKHLLFIDSHMRFDPNWYRNAMSKIISTPKTLWCGSCLGLNESNMDISKPVGVYTGADLVLYSEKSKTVFDGVWKPERTNEDDYEISCVMGACYFIHKDWYFYIKGLQQTKMWGSEEPILSIKTWLAGGEVRLMKSVRLGHKFRDISPYSTNISHIQYNKLAYMYMLFPSDLFEKIKTTFTEDGNFLEAMNLVNSNKKSLDEERRYYETIFEHDIYWLCKKFNIDIP